MTYEIERPVYIPSCAANVLEATYTVDVLELPGARPHIQRIKFNPDGSTAPIPNQMPTPKAPEGERWKLSGTAPHVYPDKVVFLHTWVREKE